MNPKREAKHELHPFEDMSIDNWTVLDEIEGRYLCSICRKSRKYFCYNCYVPVKALEGKIPKMKLPVKIDIIKHAREIDGKSTAAHAAVLAPEDVRIFTYPCIPDYGRNEKVVLVFPGKNAVSVEYFLQSCSDEPCPKRQNLGSSNEFPVTRAVFIDSTWNQTRGIYKDQRLQDLPCIVLKNRISQFWRHQNGSPRWYLATIEAIHQFFIELHNARWSSANHDPTSSVEVRNSKEETSCTISCGGSDSIKVNESAGQHMLCKSMDNSSEHRTQSGSYNGEYDNLLFFFCYMYSKIHSLYKHENLKAYKRPLK